MPVTLQTLPQNTVELTITVPAAEVIRTGDELLEQVLKTIEVPGFRPCKAPRETALSQINTNRLDQETLERLVARSYPEAVRLHNLAPVTQPAVKIMKWAKGDDLVFKATLGLRPKVVVGDYTSTLKKALQGKIATPQNPNPKLILAEVEEALLAVSQLELPPLLVEEEVNRMLSRLLDQTQRLGLTIEQYLASKNQTTEELRSNYYQTSQRNLKLGFIVEEIARLLKIETTPEEIEETIAAAPDEETRKTLAQPRQREYIELILRRQKTLQKLLEIHGKKEEK